MKTFNELTTRIANHVIEDRKNGILDSLRYINFGLICWIYDVDSYQLYNEIQKKAFVEDFK